MQDYDSVGYDVGVLKAYAFFLSNKNISFRTFDIFQIVLFLGVTILLASTYTTLYAQDEAQTNVEAVVKVAEPQDLPQPQNPIPPEEGAGNDANLNNKDSHADDGIV